MHTNISPGLDSYRRFLTKTFLCKTKPFLKQYLAFDSVSVFNKVSLLQSSVIIDLKPLGEMKATQLRYGTECYDQVLRALPHDDCLTVASVGLPWGGLGLLVLRSL